VAPQKGSGDEPVGVELQVMLELVSKTSVVLSIGPLKVERGLTHTTHTINFGAERVRQQESRVDSRVAR
jgi:hypothetical protein